MAQHNETGNTGEKFALTWLSEKGYAIKDVNWRYRHLEVDIIATKGEAAKGFDAEEAAGVPINAPHRNYKDRNHKPEVMVALSDFWLLHGFKPVNALKQTLLGVPEFNKFLPIFEKGGYYALYKAIMELPQDQMDELLLPLVERETAKADQLVKSEPGYWVNKLFAEGPRFKDIDRGICSIYFFNIVQVNPGEAVFQGAGIPHAYLEGQNVELMANSDNVLRGGLTPKHIDVHELLKHTTFEAVVPNILTGNPVSEVEKNYPCPVEDFAISSITLSPGQRYTHISATPEIYIVIMGSISHNHYGEYRKGRSFFVLPGTEVDFSASQDSLVFKAFVP